MTVRTKPCPDVFVKGQNYFSLKNKKMSGQKLASFDQKKN